MVVPLPISTVCMCILFIDNLSHKYDAVHIYVFISYFVVVDDVSEEDLSVLLSEDLARSVYFLWKETLKVYPLALLWLCLLFRIYFLTPHLHTQCDTYIPMYM